MCQKLPIIMWYNWFGMVLDELVRFVCVVARIIHPIFPHEENNTIAKSERKILERSSHDLSILLLPKNLHQVFLLFLSPSPATTISWSMFFSHVWLRPAGCKTTVERRVIDPRSVQFLQNMQYSVQRLIGYFQPRQGPNNS